MRTEGRMDGQTDMKKLAVPFRYLRSPPKKMIRVFIHSFISL
jgi:hypothetical protein